MCGYEHSLMVKMLNSDMLDCSYVFLLTFLLISFFRDTTSHNYKSKELDSNLKLITFKLLLTCKQAQPLPNLSGFLGKLTMQTTILINTKSINRISRQKNHYVFVYCR